MLHILLNMCEKLNPTILRRNDDFFAVYNSILRRFPHIAIEDAITIAIHSPAREFYTSEVYAIKHCYAIKERRPLKLKKGTAKHHCISTIYLMSRNTATARGISLRQAVISTIYSEAPRFYINRSTAYAIIKDHSQHAQP